MGQRFGMDEMLDLHVKVPRAMLEAARKRAGELDISIGQLVRSALAADLNRAAQPAKTPNRADEQLLGPLRALLAGDFASARNWDDLAARLAAKGYALREAGGGLALHSHPQGHRLCKASELGFAYSALMRQFRAPFPGHRHGHLTARILGVTPEEDFSVIERF